MSFARFSTDFRAKFARSRTPDAHFFESKRITDSFKSCSDAMQFAQRTLAESSHFLCARHAEILKILHFFHANFAAKCASSRFLTCAFFGYQCTADSVNSCSDAMGRWQMARRFCARGAPKFQKFCNSFAILPRDFGADFA